MVKTLRIALETILQMPNALNALMQSNAVLLPVRLLMRTAFLTALGSLPPMSAAITNALQFPVVQTETLPAEALSVVTLQLKSVLMMNAVQMSG